MLVAMLLAATLVAGMLVGCGADTSKAERLSPSQATSLLGQAEEIELRKARLSWGDRWDVYADGNLVATITGEALHATDTYVLHSTDDGIICSEEEQLVFGPARARKFDAEGNEDGWYEQELTLFLAKLRIVDGSGEATGSVEQNLAFGLDADIKDADGRTAWHLEKDLVSLTTSATLHLERGEAADGFDACDAVMASAVLNELTELSDSDD